MSPHCNSCGNEQEFEHHGFGWEIREYDEETGEYLRTKEADVTTEEIKCAMCNSFDVEYQWH